MSSKDNSQNTGLVVRSASITFTGLIYQLGISFVSGLIVARLIGPSQFGIFSLARNLCETMSVFTKAGFDIGIVRHFGENSSFEHFDHNAKFLRLVLLMVLILALVPVVAVVLNGKFFLASYVKKYPDFIAVMVVMVFSVPLMSLTQVLGGAYRGLLQIRPRIIAEYFLQPTIRILIILLLFLLGWRLWAAIFGTVISFGIAVVYLLFKGKNIVFSKVESVDVESSWQQLPFKDLISVAKYSIIISLTVSVSTLLQKVDVLMLGYYAPSEQVGQYSVIQMIVVLIVLSNSALNQAIAPMVARLYKEGDKNEMRRLIHQHTRWVMISSLPLFLVIGFLGNQLVAVFGKGYIVDMPPVALLAFSQLVIAVLSSAGFMLSMTGRHMLEFYTMLVALICNVILNYLLIPKMGIIGASIGTLSAVILANILRSLQVYKVHGIFPLGKEIFMPLLLGCSGFWAVLSIGQSLGIGEGIIPAVVLSVSFLIIYTLLIVKFGLIEEDRLLLRKALLKINLSQAVSP